MENPNKIEIEGLKTIHKLCNFGAEHDMEGCSFTEIVEHMFSKIEKMDEEPCFVLDDNFTELKGVTHWVRLPDSPKAQGQSHD